LKLWIKPVQHLQMMPIFCSRRRRESISVSSENGIRIDNIPLATKSV
jgi:hypothetical protein